MTRKNYLRLAGDEWHKARMRTLVRDNFCCQAYQLGITDTPCSENRLEKLQVHHIKLRVHGGSHELANLITLCQTHHEILHPWMKKCFSRDAVMFQKILPEL